MARMGEGRAAQIDEMKSKMTSSQQIAYEKNEEQIRLSMLRQQESETRRRIDATPRHPMMRHPDDDDYWQGFD